MTWTKITKKTHHITTWSMTTTATRTGTEPKRPKKKQGKKNLHDAQRLVTVGEERPAQHPFNSLVTLFVNKLKS
jgi:electron transfer flavoprotein alpha subunit